MNNLQLLASFSIILNKEKFFFFTNNSLVVKQVVGFYFILLIQSIMINLFGEKYIDFLSFIDVDDGKC